ncbi:MAG TPA: hypothetical protein VI916_09465 [Acidimicrobiia bacterium]|nr:hypothetical protein [Acidimicrobiia bacterium]
MSPGSRCDDVIRLIDEALGDPAPDAAPTAAEAPDPTDDEAPDVEEIPGHWGVYYLRPTA